MVRRHLVAPSRVVFVPSVCWLLSGSQNLNVIIMPPPGDKMLQTNEPLVRWDKLVRSKQTMRKTKKNYQKNDLHIILLIILINLFVIIDPYCWCWLGSFHWTPALIFFISIHSNASVSCLLLDIITYLVVDVQFLKQFMCVCVCLCFCISFGASEKPALSCCFESFRWLLWLFVAFNKLKSHFKSIFLCLFLV